MRHARGRTRKPEVSPPLSSAGDRRTAKLRVGVTRRLRWERRLNERVGAEHARGARRPQLRARRQVPEALKKRALIRVGVAVLTASVVAAGCGATSTTATPSGAIRHSAGAASLTRSRAPSGQTVAPNSLTITLEEFSRVELAMTLDQVTAIIGSPGTVDRASDKDRMESRSWDGRPGSGGFATIVFRDGVV